MYITTVKSDKKASLNSPFLLAIKLLYINIRLYKEGANMLANVFLNKTK